MLRATLKSLLSRKLRLVLSGLAVVLGVMFVSGAFVLTDTLTRSFDGLFTTVYSDTDVSVSAQPKVAVDEFEGESVPGTIPPDVVDRVRAVPGVAAVQAEVSAEGARVIGSNGKVITSFGPPRIGANWTGESNLVQLREGRGPTADNEIALNAALAKTAGVKVGDQVGVLTLQPKKTFTLVGIFGYSGGRDTLGGLQVVAFTDRAAQELMLGEPGQYNSIKVTAAPGMTPEAVRDAVATALGGGYDVQTGAQLQEQSVNEFEEGFGFFNNILLGFAAVALFVGTFLILNTFSILVAQRTRELALMRAIGASRRQMIGSVMVEAITIGLLASVFGLAAGIGVGALLAWVFSNVGGAALELAGIGVPAAAVIGAFVVGVGVTLVAALLPAVRASRIPPVAALQEAATPDRPLTKLTVSGAIVGAVGGTLLGLGLAGSGGGNELWFILGGVLLTFIGVALLTPLIARPVVSVIGRLMSWSVPGKLGRLNSGRNPRRTAITAAALMVGLALITGVNIVLSSATASLHKIGQEQVTADLIISGDGSQGLARFDPAVLERMREIPGVARTAAEYWDDGLLNGERWSFPAVPDVAEYAAMFKLRATMGTLAWNGPEQAVIDEENAKDYGLKVGDVVTVQLSRGEPHQITIVGVFAQSEVSSGLILSGDLVTDFQVAQPSFGYLTLAPGASLPDVQQRVDALLVDSPEVTVSDRRGFVDQLTAPFDTVLLMIQILLALAILIAVLGIVNTLALSVLERTRELGLLRAIGLRRGQTMRMVTVEAVLISVFGALLGLVVGTGLGAAVVRALRDEGFTEFALPWSAMGTYLALAAIVGVVAAILPAIRAARVNVLSAIAYE